MPIAIEPIALRHVAGFRSCLDTVARERRYLAQTEAPPPERVEAFVRENIASDAVQFVALDGATVVGWADILSHWASAFAHRGTLGIGVLPAYRGRGIARQLLLACLAKARATGLTRIELEVRADNTRAIRLYRAVGFVEECRKRKAMRFDGVYFDALLMSLVDGQS